MGKPGAFNGHLESEQRLLWRSVIAGPVHTFIGAPASGTATLRSVFEGRKAGVRTRVARFACSGREASRFRDGKIPRAGRKGWGDVLRSCYNGL